MAQKRVVFNYDAAKGLVLLMQVDDRYITLDAQVAYLEDRGLLPRGIDFDPAEPLRRGVLAVMLQRALGIRGGLGLRLFGSTPRYALKELSARGLMAGGLPNDLVSGPEFVQALNGAAEYRLKALGAEAP